jgi:SAM-dependent methyltransferase
LNLQLSRQRYFEFAQRALEKNAGEILPDIQDEKEMRMKYPAHFEVTSRISDVHETIFQSSKVCIVCSIFYHIHTCPQSAVDSLYSDDLMTRFYSRGNQTSTVYEEAARSFACLLDSLQSSGKRVINILEVGAGRILFPSFGTILTVLIGVGSLTTYLIRELKQKPHLLAEYTVTDTSYVIYFLRNFAPFLNDLQALASELAHTVQYHKTTPKIYDLTKDAGGQGLLPESYDIIVSSHVLHVAPDIRACLSSLQDLLVPGGSLFVVELDGTSWGEKVGSVWFDCVFGAFSEWFAFADGRTHCTMSPASWMEKLEDLGFINAHASVEPGNGGHNFLFTAQKPAAVVQSAIPGATQINPDHVLQYSFGNEMELQSHLNELSPKELIDLYLVALDGRDGHSAMGLCATLQREFPFWEIRLAIFESATHLSNPLDFISIHRGVFNHGEKVVWFPCEGSPRVSRVILSPSPAIIPYDYPLPLVDSDHLIIELIASEATAVSIHGFVGRVLESRLKTPSPGDLVVGLTDQNTTPIFVAHVGCVASLEVQQLHNHPNPAELTKVVAPALILASLPTRGPHSRIRVVVAISDENMSHSIATHFGTIQTVTVLQCDFRDDDPSRLVDVVISDLPTSTLYPHIRHWVPRSGRLILWDDLLRDNIRNNTWEISRALQPGLLQLPAMSNGQLLPLAKSVSGSHLSLFRHDRSYILLGGIGGLGVDLAVWMYQVGPNSCNNSILCSFLNLSAELDTSSLHPERASPRWTRSGTPMPYRKSSTSEAARISCFGLNNATQRTHAQHHCSSKVSMSLSRAASK